MGADRSERKWRHGALQFLDLRLVEDGGEPGGALGSDAVARDAVSEGQDGNVRE